MPVRKASRHLNVRLDSTTGREVKLMCISSAAPAIQWDRRWYQDLEILISQISTVPTGKVLDVRFEPFKRLQAKPEDLEGPNRTWTKFWERYP